jgi:hypothetical protein
VRKALDIFFYTVSEKKEFSAVSLLTVKNARIEVVGGLGLRRRYSHSFQDGRSGDRISVRERYSAPLHNGPEAHATSYTRGTRSLPRVKQRGRVGNHPPPFSVEIKEIEELYFHSFSRPSWYFPGQKFLLPF